MTETKEHSENMGLVGRQVKCFPPNNVCDKDDFLQTGSIALLQAIRKRNPERGGLSTYAWSIIYRDIKRQQADKFSRKPARYHDLVVWDKEGLWEILPDNLTDQEKRCVHLKVDGYSIREINKQMKINRKEFEAIFQSACEKIKEANQNQ